MSLSKEAPIMSKMVFACLTEMKFLDAKRELNPLTKLSSSCLPRLQTTLSTLIGDQEDIVAFIPLG